MKGPVLMALAAGLLVAADAPEGDLGRFQGTWALVSIEADGELDSPELAEKARLRLVIEGESFTLKGEETTRVKGTIRLDPAATPKAYDSTYDDGTRLKGIYQLDGDSLKLCIAPPGVDRPASFETKPGDRLTIATYRREAPAPDAGPARGRVAAPRRVSRRATRGGREMRHQPRAPARQYRAAVVGWNAKGIPNYERPFGQTRGKFPARRSRWRTVRFGGRRDGGGRAPAATAPQDGKPSWPGSRPPPAGETAFDVLDRAGLIGCIEGTPHTPIDLSTNSRHMESFGRE